MAHLIDLTGQTFTHLTVLARDMSPHPRDTRAWWICDCHCGTRIIASGHALRRKEVKSCGCLKSAIQHGHARKRQHTPEYRIWAHMRKRCSSPTDTAYKNYGGRGITVCERWQHSFTAFFADMGKRPSPKHTLERCDNNGPYTPENCRWATRKEQVRNTRLTSFLTWNGQTLSLGAWADILHIDPHHLHARKYLKWSIERMLTTPVILRRKRTRA